MEKNKKNLKEIKEDKSSRVLELFFRALKGESLSVQELAYEYNVSTRSVSRDITDLKIFLAEHRDVLGYAELEYSSSNHKYTLYMDSFMSNKDSLLQKQSIDLFCQNYQLYKLIAVV